MLPDTIPSIILALSLFVARVSASVTIYTTTSSAASAAPQPTLCIGAVPCDGNVLQPMPNPTGPNLSQIVPVQLYPGGMNSMGIPVSGSFFGFSLELSVANRLFGNDGNKLVPIFLNLMATITNRAGKVLLRVGGNSQESAAVVPGGLPNDTAILKVQTGADKTFTPTLLVSPSLVYAMGNISSLLPIDWFIGLPFNDTTNPRLELAEIAQSVLGKNLIGMQLGNEPDLYAGNGIRPNTYQPADYTTDFGTVLHDYQSDPSVPNTNIFVAPSVCCGSSGNGWTPETVFNTGFLSQFSTNLAYISVEHYPTNNCNDSGILDPAALMASTFLNHGMVSQLSQQYWNTSQIAVTMGKPFIMFETNTASCGGFSGLSDSFASAMWSVDYALNMAYVNFSNALWHVGGESDYYNPFTPPATNQSHFRQWTIGPTFYSGLVVAEALGNSGQARVVDLFLNNNNNFSPGYAIYENGNPQRVVLINYLTDPSGASNYTAYISVGGNATNTPGGTPSSVLVKYLLSPSATEKFNITWAGQTFGGAFESDGRLTGTEQTYTYTCDQTNNVCAVPMPAPAVAIVFLSSSAQSESGPSATQTFSTSGLSAGHAANTATVAQAVLATSNGRGGGNWVGLGSTSPGSSSGAFSERLRSSSLVIPVVVVALTSAATIFRASSWYS
ncbi:hypothetical protein BD410DRAFT_745703 [Rickenella mellea]|uniref:Beta-glucuronidase C-terminal domain-containing protein n=1 Tax=Rickenella mellea TaxID=50990 RepID=A0A4Y7QAK8_9AGAM|nr:hypothetical protein BD410DRAFT_745703 [Rickenella mellea]